MSKHVYMEDHREFFKQQLSEQLALEEQLCKIIADQLSEIDGTEFLDAKNLLIKTNQVLERQFTALNSQLDKLEQDAVDARNQAIVSSRGVFGHLATNGHETINSPVKVKMALTSKILRDDYTALNLITMNNTLLHTAALALDSQDVAKLALQHLKNLAPLVVRLGELMPEVVARELRAISKKIDLSIAETALKNTQLAWRRAS